MPLVLAIVGLLIGVVAKVLCDACAMADGRKPFPKPREKKLKSGDLDDETRVACGCTWFF